ncbi:MAG: flagellar export chaperone FliS [Planctomycetes bacterium]|jgi:flagellar protein FliS|nr:flagellar export chaperone FliS [Planctomycetota bacterium]
MKGIAAYQENAVTTQSPGKVVVLLYEGAIKFLTRAAEEIENGNPGQKGYYINKGIDIVDELNASLDIEAGGEIAQNLRSLYVFMMKHLNQANIKQDAEMVRHVIKLLEDLNSAWKAIV